MTAGDEDANLQRLFPDSTARNQESSAWSSASGTEGSRLGIDHHGIDHHGFASHSLAPSLSIQ